RSRDVVLRNRAGDLPVPCRSLSPKARSEPSRSSLPSQQQRRADETGNDAKEVKHAETHQTIKRIGVAERSQGTHVGVHDAIEHRVEDATENPAPHRNWHSALGRQSFGNKVACAGPPDTNT